MSSPTTPDPIATVFNALLQARQGGPAADDQRLQPTLDTVEQAYAVQERVWAGLQQQEGVPRHWKSGAATRTDAVRHAPLPTQGVRSSGASLADLGLRHRWIEAEVALRLGRDVRADEAQQATPAAAGELVDAMCVSIEVLDSRWAGARGAPPLLKLADFLMHGALVLGEFVPCAARDWSQQACRVRIGHGGALSFQGSLGIGDPAWVLPAWLRHATRHGGVLRAGTVVSCGSWCGVLDAQAGDTVVAEFPGIGVARVEV
jgi:2-keto-4-pentenoate hydratase